jgi:hypothetical protein
MTRFTRAFSREHPPCPPDAVAALRAWEEILALTVETTPRTAHAEIRTHQALAAIEAREHKLQFESEEMWAQTNSDPTETHVEFTCDPRGVPSTGYRRIPIVHE